MSKHSLGRLINLVDTAYYQQDDRKAVCEIHGKEGDKIQISLFVNGTQVTNISGMLEDVLKAHNLNLNGWTIRPQ